MQEITSINNSKVKYWAKLKRKKYRDLYNKFIIEGEHLVEIALKLNLVVELITTSNCYEFDNTYLVTDTIINNISTLKSAPKVMAVINKLEEKDYQGNILILDDIQDPGNLGTIIRSGVAFNINTIILSESSVDLYNPKTINSSEGMIFNINVIKRDLKIFIDEIKNKRYTVYGTDVNNGISLNEIKKDDLIAIVIGNEGSGIKKEILNKCDQKICIEMNNKCESLNVGVATGIILYNLQ